MARVKKVYQYDLKTGLFIHEFPKAKDIELRLGLYRGSIGEA